MSIILNVGEKESLMFLRIYFFFLRRLGICLAIYVLDRKL